MDDHLASNKEKFNILEDCINKLEDALKYTRKALSHANDSGFVMVYEGFPRKKAVEAAIKEISQVLSVLTSNRW